VTRRSPSLENEARGWVEIAPMTRRSASDKNGPGNHPVAADHNREVTDGIKKNESCAIHYVKAANKLTQRRPVPGSGVQACAIRMNQGGLKMVAKGDLLYLG
jgi:hypothetical protein